MKRQPIKRMDYTDWTVERHADYLRTYPPYQDYFANYSKTAVEYFIDSYARQKKDMLANKARYKADYETLRTLFLTHADAFIDLILQKKLLNLQCQWRAGLINLPYVLSSHDFRYWADNIRSCPIIPPITEAEINLCIRFLTQNIDYQTADWDGYDADWQDYENFKAVLGFYDDDDVQEGIEAYNYDNDDDDDDDDDNDDDDENNDDDDDGFYPMFYRFFDKHQNTGHLWALRDVRTAKEEVYMDEARRLYHQKREAEAKANGTWKEPDLALRKELTEHARNPDLLNTAQFVEAVEDSDTKEAYSYQAYWADIYNEEWSTEDYIEFLTQFNEAIEIEAHADWRKAVELTARRFRQKKIADMMPYAYATYALEFDEDLSPEANVEAKVARYAPNKTSQSYELLLMMREMLLDGRASLDGIRDFNIY